MCDSPIGEVRLITRIILVALVAAILVSGAGTADAHAARRVTGPEFVALHHCAAGHVTSCIHRAALHRHVSYGYMLAISFRESRWLPWARNSGSTARGLFQFLASTWAGGWNPYRFHSVLSAKWNALAAALAMSEGHWSWWAATL